jgi:hypothetical protein
MAEHSIPELSDDIDIKLFKHRQIILPEISRIINQPQETLQASRKQIEELEKMLSKFELPRDAFSHLTPFRWYLFFHNENISNVALVMDKADIIEDGADDAVTTVSSKRPSKRPSKRRSTKMDDDSDDDFIVDNIDIPQGNPFIDKCGSVQTHRKQISDLEYRTRIIVEDLYESGKTGIDTLDGHGRTLYLLLHHIYQKNISEKKIVESISLTFFEIDRYTQMWHNIFFPQRRPKFNDPRLTAVSITPIFRDILDPYYDNIERLKEKILYLNFLSLGNEDQISKLKNIVVYFNQSSLKSIVYISFTSRAYSNIAISTPVRVKGYFKDPVGRNFRSDITRYILKNFKCICRRNLFVTYKLILTEEKPVPVEEEEPVPKKRSRRISSSSNGGYYNKYLKYKQKYVQLKNELNNLKL